MQVPNALWLSIIAAVQLVVNQNYSDLWWTPVAIALLVAVAKLLEVNVVPPPPASTTRGLSPEGAAQTQPGKLRRFLIG